LTTQLFFSAINNDGADVHEILLLILKAGVQITIFDSSTTVNRQTFTIDSDAIDNTTYFTVNVTFQNSTATFSNNQSLEVFFQDGAQTPAAVLAVNTKGDILVRNNIELVRLALGARGFFLRSDPDEDTGIKWASQQNFFTQDYSWKTDLGTPGNGDIKGNNADQTLITILRISKTNGNNQNIGAILELLLLANTKLGILDENTSGDFNYYSMDVAAVDQGTYFDCTVTFLQSTTTHGNNAKVVLLINTGAQVLSVFSAVSTASLLLGHGLDLIRLNAVENKLEFVDLSMDDIDETATKKILTDLERISISSAEQVANKGANNGYTPLDSSALVPLANLPASVKTGSEYKGVYNATTNTPTLINGTGSNGDYHRVNVAGTQDFGAGSITFDIGDLVLFNGTSTLWELVNGNPDLVQSVAGKQGVVTLDMDDFSETATGKILTDLERSKLSGVEDNATQDQTGAEIKAAYEVEANAYTDIKNTKLNGIEASATQDQSDGQIETAYNNQVSIVSQAEAEAGASTTVRRWTAERVKKAIEALMTVAGIATINFSYTGENGDGAETKSASYETVASFIFEGSTALAVISAIKVIVSADGATSGSIRIFDFTNTQVIAELSMFTETSQVIKDLGTISNVPAGEALFEVQLLKTGGGGAARVLCSSVQVKF